MQNYFVINISYFLKIILSKCVSPETITYLNSYMKKTPAQRFIFSS